MAATPEVKVKEKIKKLLKAHDAYYTMPVMTGLASNGTPDFIVGHAGRFLGLEAKAGKGEPTELQWVRMGEIVRAGGSTMVINEDNLEVLESWLKNTTLATRVFRAEGSKKVKGHEHYQ